MFHIDVIDFTFDLNSIDNIRKYGNSFQMWPVISDSVLNINLLSPSAYIHTHTPHHIYISLSQ